MGLNLQTKWFQFLWVLSFQNMLSNFALQVGCFEIWNFKKSGIFLDTLYQVSKNLQFLVNYESKLYAQWIHRVIYITEWLNVQNCFKIVQSIHFNCYLKIEKTFYICCSMHVTSFVILYITSTSLKQTSRICPISDTAFINRPLYLVLSSYHYFM